MPLKTRVILVLSIGLVLGLGLPLSSQWLDMKQSRQSRQLLREGALLAEVMARVKSDYVDALTDEELLQSAVDGMVGALDAHSEFLNADEYAEIRISSTGNYSGVGIEVSLDENKLKVVAPFDGTPAARAGIRPGDVIVNINGYQVHSERLSEAVNRLRGKPGTRVGLTIVRDDHATPLNFTLTRSYVKVASVRSEMLQDDVGYVRISQFNEATAGDVKKAVRRLRRENEQDLSGLVVDLRNNPGGVLDSAVQVADLFLDEGVIVSARGRDQKNAFVHSARRGDILRGAGLVLLVNEGSASASEIVAGALRDHRRASLVGTTTFGKGSVQTVMPLSNGNAIKLTTSRYFTPSGLSIHGIGIQPDFEIAANEDALRSAMRQSVPDLRADDPQLVHALGILESPYILHSKAP